MHVFNFLFLKILTIKAKISVLLSQNAKIFKNKKLIKKSEKTFLRYMYLDGFG